MMTTRVCPQQRDTSVVLSRIGGGKQLCSEQTKQNGKKIDREREREKRKKRLELSVSHVVKELQHFQGFHSQIRLFPERAPFPSPNL